MTATCFYNLKEIKALKFSSMEYVYSNIGSRAIYIFLIQMHSRKTLNTFQVKLVAKPLIQNIVDGTR